jgi:hypothetical protein
MVSSIQEQITKANEEFQAFLKQCLKDKQALQDAASELGRYVVLINVDFITYRMCFQRPREKSLVKKQIVLNMVSLNHNELLMYLKYRLIL